MGSITRPAVPRQPGLPDGEVVARLDNQGGTLSSAGALAATGQGAPNNQGGRLAS
ncbi:hypothetical protein P4048_00065 [Pseudomonas aeruginosa]|nr:hypothetical protein [Pseudomonas aeruginosa]